MASSQSYRSLREFLLGGRVMTSWSRAWLRACLTLLLVLMPTILLGSSEDEARAAVGRGDTEALQNYLDGGGDPNLADPQGKTLLHGAAEQGGAESVRLLLERGADPHQRDGRNCTALHIAAARGKLDAARELLDGGSVVDSPGFSPPDGPSESTPLILASESGVLELVQLLVERGANVNAVNAFERTPLFWARKARKTAVAEYLESQGAFAEPEEALSGGGVRTAEINQGTEANPEVAEEAEPEETEPEEPEESQDYQEPQEPEETQEPEEPQETQDSSLSAEEGDGSSEVTGPDKAPVVPELPRVEVPKSPVEGKLSQSELLALRKLGVASWKAGEPRKAAQALAQVLRQAPRDKAARSYMALSLWSLGKKDAARKQLGKLAKLDPELARKVEAKFR